MGKKRLKPSEFEKTGTHKSGTLGKDEAGEKLRINYRMGKDPDSEDVDLDGPVDDFGTGGVRSPDQKI